MSEVKKIATRDSYGNALVELGKEFDNLVVLDADLAGLQFVNPYEIPKEFKKQEPVIRELLQTKAKIEEKLSSIKASILLEMESTGAKTWLTDTMRISRKLPSTRTSFNLVAFKSDHPDLEYDAYMKTTQVGGSLQIAI